MSKGSVDPPARDPWGVVPQRLRPPVLRGDLLERPALVDRLRSSGATCVALRAGAGYGKTTLLRQWADADGRAVAWVGLDPSDDDPVVLFRHVVRSLGSAGLDLTEAGSHLASREPLLTHDVLPALARAVDQPTVPFLLVLDDVHVVGRAETVDLLDRFLDAVTAGSTVALAGRSMPALHLARRGLDGSALELRQDQLSFTETEATDLVRRALPQLTAAEVDQLVERTERWPAGLSLGVLALRDHPDPPVLIRGLLGRDHRVVDYLHEEVLDHLPDETSAFLLRAAVLDRLSGDLCDAVLGRDDSRARLQELTDAGYLFVVEVDEEPDAFRLHQLVAELLVAQLRRTDPDEELRVRRRAADWHDEHGEGDPAVRQAVATGDLAFATEVLYRRLFPSMVRGELASLERWIGMFPPRRVATDPLLALCAGWLALGRGHRSELDRYLDLARSMSTSVSGPLPDGTADYDVALAALEMTASLDGVKDTAARAAVVVEAGPAGSPWWPMARLLEAVSLSLAGAADPVTALRAVEIDTRGLPAVHAVTLAQLGLAQICSGDPEGQATVRRAVGELHHHRLEHYVLAVMVRAAESLAAALRGDAMGSTRAAEETLVLLGIGSGVVTRAAIQARLALAEAALVRRDHADAVILHRGATAHLSEEPDAVVLHEWADGLRQQLERTRSRSETPELSAAELRVLAELPTHRSLGEIGEQLYVSRNTVKTHTVSIYRKLRVSGRSEAVERAGELGLLDVDPAAATRPGPFTPSG